MTAAFPDLSLDGVAQWAAANGFEMLEVACWPASGGEQRRYAGVTHIDVEALDADEVHRMFVGMEPMDEMLRASGQYGPRVEVADDADAVSRLMAFIGRRP